MERQQEYTVVDWRKVFKEIWKRKKLYFIVVPIVMILASLYIVSIPRGYTTDTEIIPETQGDLNSNTGALGSLASSFGFDMSNLESSDAITPMLYPDLLKDNGFIVSLFKIKIITQDGKIKTDYFTYISKYQKKAWWNKIIGEIKSKFTKKQASTKKQLDPYDLPKKTDDVVKNIRNSLSIKVDKKTGSITISVSDQDPLVCKTIADSARTRLENFITNYRTKKAKDDYAYYKKLTEEAHADYQKIRRQYGSYSDANEDVILQSVKSKQEDLENEMQLKYNAYTTLSTQMDAARAKVLAKTPAFTLIQGAAVPIKPESPKRMIFVLVWAFIAFGGTTIYVLRDIILPKEG